VRPLPLQLYLWIFWDSLFAIDFFAFTLAHACFDSLKQIKRYCGCLRLTNSEFIEKLVSFLDQRLFVFTAEGIHFLDNLLLLGFTPSLIKIFRISISPHSLVVLILIWHVHSLASIGREKQVYVGVQYWPLRVFLVLSHISLRYIFSNAVIIWRKLAFHDKSFLL
jgi:hypothetical protein